jgi:excinuclease ABC subunit C
MAERTSSRGWLELGRTRYAARRSPFTLIDLPSDLADTRAILRERCPHQPGVYAFFDADDRLIYVGMSIDLRKRLSCYFFDRTDDVKERRIASHANRVGWEPVIHPLTAHLRELELIRRWKPRFNVKGQSERFRVGYVYLTTEEAPRFRVERTVPRDCRRWWGPVSMGGRTRSAVERLNYAYRLRDCSQDVPMRFADQSSLFDIVQTSGCLRADTGTCAGPCASRCSRTEYLAQIEQACRLLDGDADEALAQYQAAMQEAAARRRFEQAAALRDTWQELTYLRDQFETLHLMQRDYWFVYPLTSATGREHWYFIAGGVIAHVARTPQTASSSLRCLQWLEDMSEHRGGDLQSENDVAQMFLLASWFRKHPEELDRTISLSAAKELCRARIVAQETSSSEEAG